MDANNNDIRESGGNCIFSTYFVQHCSDHQLVKSEPHAWTSFMICKNKKAMGKLESVRKIKHEEKKIHTTKWLKLQQREWTFPLLDELLKKFHY
jgi:hypothetical protein